MDEVERLGKKASMRKALMHLDRRVDNAEILWNQRLVITRTFRIIGNDRYVSLADQGLLG